MYLDPGFAGMLIQVLIASVAGVVAVFGIFRVKIKAFFTKGKKPRKIDAGESIPDVEENIIDTEENTTDE